MKFKPIGNYVLCSKVKAEEKQDGFICKTDHVPEYKIEEIGADVNLPEIKPGIIVICDSTGTKVNDGETEYWLFGADHIAGIEI